MADAQSGFDWGSLIGPGLNLGAAYLGSQQNNNAAQAAQNSGTVRPYNVYGPNGAATFSGNNISLGQSPNSAALQNYLQQGGSNLFGNYLNAQQGPGSLNELAGETDYANKYTDPTQSLQLGSSFMNQLGSTDPNQLANSYANNLGAMSAQGNQLAANSLANRLFSQGRLGSTGGQTMFGQLMNSQNQNQIAQQVAGQQYGQQQQQGLLNNALALNNQGMSQVQARYGRAQSLFGANQAQSGNQLQGFQAAMGQNNTAQNGLLNMAQFGGQLGLGTANQNFNAAQPTLNAQQSQNSALYGGLGNLAGNINYGGLLNSIFGNGSGSSGGGEIPSNFDFGTGLMGHN